jgi:hypothetical protein
MAGRTWPSMETKWFFEGHPGTMLLQGTHPNPKTTQWIRNVAQMNFDFSLNLLASKHGNYIMKIADFQ